MLASSPKTRLAVPSVSVLASPWLQHSCCVGSYAGGYSNLYTFMFVFLVLLRGACVFTELIEVGQHEDANQALYDIITDSQTRRRQWSKTYEGIMLKLMELSVDLRKPHMVKEALHKYRATCMQSNVASLDEVVRYLVKLAEERTEAARSKVDQDAVAYADDLEEDAVETPETLLLEAAGNALTKERVDRQEVVPWMRFLWEVYRVGLDIVKSHSKLEVCYHEMAERAFAFCTKYKRFMEFRRLSDMLRQHLNQLIHYPRHSPNDVKITDADTLQKFLETRFTQLYAAVQLEHWQEAYRTIEDIHAIMNMSKSRPRPQHMSVYYDKLMQVFWVSGNYLYHAHALWKLYTLSVKQNRNLSAADTKTLASRLMLAALSIPVYDAQSAVLSDSYGVMSDVLGTPMSENAARHGRMASLLNYSSAAERGTLINELVAKGVANACHDELKDLLDLLEGDMAPLQFSDRTKKILAFVESNPVLAEYAMPLRRVAIYRLLEQLGRVYDVMRLSDMKRVASFATYEEVEDTALTALKTRSLAVRFDHQHQCLRFESELFSTDGMRSQLGRLARRMALASKMLTEKSLIAAETAADREVLALSFEREKAATQRRRAAIAAAKTCAKDEESRILARRALIERRKEDAERRTAEAVRQKKQAAAREMAVAERARKTAEAKRRYDEQQARESRIASGEAGRLAMSDELGGGGQGVIGGDVEGDAEREARMTKERELELKNQREMEKRVQQLALHMNYAERALRENQWDKLKDLHTKEAEYQVVQTQEMARREVSEAEARHARALVDKSCTARIMPELQKYLAVLMVRVDRDFDSWAQKERARVAAIEAQEEAERLAREEQERREAEEAERKRVEAVEAEEAERVQQETEERERLRAESGGKYVPLALRAARSGTALPVVEAPSPAIAVAKVRDGDSFGRSAPPGGDVRPRIVNSRANTGDSGAPERNGVSARPSFSSFGNRARDGQVDGTADGPGRPSSRYSAPGRDAGPPSAAKAGAGAPTPTESAPLQRRRFINSKKMAAEK
jgi:translation initiation factor 3 subunit A